MAREVCVDCGAPADVSAGPDCENVAWHQPEPAAIAVVPERHHTVDLETVSLVAINLHRTWCPLDAPGCTYTGRDLQVALDAALAARA